MKTDSKTENEKNKNRMQYILSRYCIFFTVLQFGSETTLISPQRYNICCILKQPVINCVCIIQKSSLILLKIYFNLCWVYGFTQSYILKAHCYISSCCFVKVAKTTVWFHTAEGKNWIVGQKLTMMTFKVQTLQYVLCIISKACFSVISDTVYY